MTRPRLWPAFLIIALVIVALLFVWTGESRHRQMAVMSTLTICAVGLVLLAVWAVTFSRLARRTRLKIGIGFVTVLLLAAATVRISGVTGDFVPILSWRWSEESFGAVSSSGSVDDAILSNYPQFLGPDRNAKLTGVEVEVKDWTTHPPRELWRIRVGQGWSAFAVSGRTAVTQEQRGEEECVVAYDVLTGEEVWVHEDRVRYESAIAGTGPRATPTITGNRVYTVGSTGLLNCLDLSSGERVWSVNILEDNDARRPEWGVAGSPLVLGDTIVVSAGGRDGRSLVAYHARDGEFVWGGGSARAGYSSPSLRTVAGRRQILIFNKGSVAGHDPSSGRVLWEAPWPMPGGNQCVAQPLPIGEDGVFVSSGYGVGCRLYRLEAVGDSLRVAVVYSTPRMKAKFTNVIEYEGSIYGLDDGVLVCLDPATGERRWKRGRYGHGQILLVGDRLIVQTEDGDVVLVDPDPERHIELARIPALDSKTWNNPVLAGSLLIVRNNREAVCYVVEVEADG